MSSILLSIQRGFGLLSSKPIGTRDQVLEVVIMTRRVRVNPRVWVGRVEILSTGRVRVRVTLLGTGRVAQMLYPQTSTVGLFSLENQHLSFVTIT